MEKRTFGFYPTELSSYIKTRGFELVYDIGSVEYRARCMNPHGRHMNGYEFYRIASTCPFHTIACLSRFKSLKVGRFFASKLGIKSHILRVESFALIIYQ